VCGWEDDGTEDTPWMSGGANEESFWEARVRFHRPELDEAGVQRELVRLRDEEVERRMPGYLADLSRVLDIPVGPDDLLDPVAADKLSLRFHNGPMPDGWEDSADDEAGVDEILGDVHAAGTVAVLHLGLEALLGVAQVDAHQALRRWRELRAWSPFVFLCAPDLSGGVSIMPMDDGFEVRAFGTFAG
jgi:hypothetical protein